MYSRLIMRIILVSSVAVLLAASLHQGFGDAWLAKYTYASAPAQPAPPLTPKAPAPHPAQAESLPAPKPKPIPLSQRIVEYHIDVHLHEDGHRLHGMQTVTWINPGRKAVDELYFHLYPNAFEGPDTTFMKESGGQLRGDQATADSVGSMRILSIKGTDNSNIAPRLQYVSPDDDNPDDRTVAKLRLPEAVAPGDSITLRMEFDVTLPVVFARMGYSGDFIMAGQWFPKVAVYEPKGLRGRAEEGWNVHQYHGNTEFYADFGIYNVRIKVPDRYKVAGTGFLTKPPVAAAGVKTYHFYAEDVHDFAWAASPDFIVHEEPFSSKGVPGVRVKLYLDPLHADFKDRYMHAAKASLAKYAEWFGDYPYSTLSVIVPPKGASGAGGMEYPTLITAFAAEGDSPGYTLERTVVHEVGHQFFYGMVASNEFEEAWLDEGFTSYAEDKVMEAIYGVEPNLSLEASFMTNPAPLKQPSWLYGTHDQYAENVYLRAKLVLFGMERMVGEKKMKQIMRAYFQAYKFKHPTSSDFQRVVERVTGTDWDDFFNAFVYGREMADVSVDFIRVNGPLKNEDGSEYYESTVRLTRHGGSLGAVGLLMQFADGTTVPRIWDGKGTQVDYNMKHTSPIVWAMADPNRSNVLDNKQINNFLKADIPLQQRNRFTLGIVKTIELFISRIGW